MDGTVLDQVKRMARGVVPLSAVLFLSAGTLSWLAAWCFVALFVANQTVMAVVGGRHRSKAPPARPGRRGWRMPTRVMLSLTIGLVAGLQYRFGWSPRLVPGVQLAAWGLGIAGVLLNVWAMSANHFFHGVARSGKDGHHLLTGGPYRFLRHPSSSGVLVFNLCKPLMLGSLWALVPAMLVVVQVFRHTSREDRTLRSELGGYERYSETVRYRVLPGVW